MYPSVLFSPFFFFFFFFSPPLISLLYYAYCVTQYQSLSGEEGRKEGRKERRVLLSSGKSKCTLVSSRFDKERKKREGRREGRERENKIISQSPPSITSPEQRLLLRPFLLSFPFSSDIILVPNFHFARLLFPLLSYLLAYLLTYLLTYLRKILSSAAFETWFAGDEIIRAIGIPFPFSSERDRIVKRRSGVGSPLLEVQVSAIRVRKQRNGIFHEEVEEKFRGQG